MQNSPRYSPQWIDKMKFSGHIVKLTANGVDRFSNGDHVLASATFDVLPQDGQTIWTLQQRVTLDQRSGMIMEEAQ